MPNSRELPFLAGIAGVLRWFEELASIISGPLLTFGLGVALVDLLTDGALLASQPWMLYAWAISQAVGVDAQLVASWDKARQALRSRRYWALVGLLVLGVALAYVGYLAAIVFAMQQSAGITTAQALARLGMDNATWLVSRAVLSVLLVCLSGWTRYHPPAASSVEEEAAKLQRELTLEPLRAQVRMRKAVGWRDVGRSIIQGDAAGPSLALPAAPYDGLQPPETAHNADVPARETDGASATTDAHSVPTEPPTRPPTGPGSPARARRNASKRSGRVPATPPAILRLPVERRVAAIIEQDPDVSIRQLAARAHVSESTASKYGRLYRGKSTVTGEIAQ